MPQGNPSTHMQAQQVLTNRKKATQNAENEYFRQEVLTGIYIQPNTSKDLNTIPTLNRITHYYDKECKELEDTVKKFVLAKIENDVIGCYTGISPENFQPDWENLLNSVNENDARDYLNKNKELIEEILKITKNRLSFVKVANTLDSYARESQNVSNVFKLEINNLVSKAIKEGKVKNTYTEKKIELQTLHQQTAGYHSTKNSIDPLTGRASTERLALNQVEQNAPEKSHEIFDSPEKNNSASWFSKSNFMKFLSCGSFANNTSNTPANLPSRKQQQ